MTLPSSGTTRTIRLRDATTGLTSSLASCFYAAVIDALNGRRKSSTVSAWVNCWSLFMRNVQDDKAFAINTVTLAMFKWGTRTWGPSQKKLLLGILKFWMGRRYPGIASELQIYLRTSKVPKPRSTTEVQANEVSERPFSLARVKEITMRVESLYMSGEFDPQDNLLWRLIISEALRPSQIALLQFQDIDELSVSGWKGVELKVAMVKLHATPARSNLVPVTVAEAVATALRDHLAYMRSISGKNLLPQQPLFSVVRRPATVKHSPLSINELIDRTRRKISGEVGDLVHTDLFCRRFKHTKLTHLAMLGAPIEVLARAAFHSSEGSLKYYVNFTDERFEEYEEKLSGHHESIDGAFRGNLIEQGEQTSTNTDNLILDETMTGCVGACGRTPCGVLAPVGCYVCPRFEAFIDGPHEAVLNGLLADRARAAASGLPTETVTREDYLISAVREVVNRANLIRVHSAK